MRRVAAALLVTAAVVLGSGLTAGAQDGTTTTSAGKTPTLQTADGAYDRGQTIEVEGEHWPSNTLLTVELCGNEAANGSVDCDARTSRTVATTREGLLRAQLLATAPPASCPCVVHVFQPQGILDYAVRVRINGVPSAPVVQETGPKRTLDVTEARLTGSNGIGAWFGAAPERSLELTIENTGDTPIDSAAVRAGLGRASSPDQPIDIADLEPLAPGASVTVTVPVKLAALSAGEYVVAGRIAGFEDSDFRASTSTFPYGLVVVAIVAVIAIVLVVRRRSGGDEEEGAVPPAGAAGSDGVAATPDGAAETGSETPSELVEVEEERVPG